MSEVFAPRYLAGLVSTHGWLRSRHLCQTPLNGGEAYPVRTWLLSWNRAIQIQKEECMVSAQYHSCGSTGNVL